MATKAELEAELADLKREMKQRKEEVGSGGSDIAATKHTARVPEAEGLRELLDEHDINANTLDTLSANLQEELTELQKEKPLVVLAVAFVLGIAIGRAFK